MAKKSDVNQLRRENEILRRELETLRQSAKKKEMVRSGVSAPVKTKSVENARQLVVDFRYLKNDLFRTGTLTAICITVIVILFSASGKVPAINSFINSLKI